MHDYNQKSCDHVLKIVQAENARLMPNKVKILADVVKADGDGTVDFALLGAKGHEVLSANKEATRAGMSANQLNSTRQWKNFAPAEKMGSCAWSRIRKASRRPARRSNLTK